MDLKTFRFQLVEIPVGTVAIGVGGRLKIPDQPQLRTQTGQTIIVQALSTYDVESQPTTPSGATTASVAALANAYLVLNVFGIETNYMIPMNELNLIQSSDTAVQRFYSGARWIFNNITKIDWSKSYLQFGAVTAANQTFLLGVWYAVLPDDRLTTAPTAFEMPIVAM